MPVSKSACIPAPGTNNAQGRAVMSKGWAALLSELNGYKFNNEDGAKHRWQNQYEIFLSGNAAFSIDPVMVLLMRFLYSGTLSEMHIRS